MWLPLWSAIRFREQTLHNLPLVRLNKMSWYHFILNPPLFTNHFQERKWYVTVVKRRGFLDRTVSFTFWVIIVKKCLNLDLFQRNSSCDQHDKILSLYAILLKINTLRLWIWQLHTTRCTFMRCIELKCISIDLIHIIDSDAMSAAWRLSESRTVSQWLWSFNAVKTVIYQGSWHLFEVFTDLMNIVCACWYQLLICLLV